MLLPALEHPADSPMVRAPEGALSAVELRDAASVVAARVGDARVVAVWATPSLATVVAVVGSLAAGAAVLPLAPKSGTEELRHALAEIGPDALLAEAGAELPEAVAHLRRVDVDPSRRDGGPLPPEPAEDAPALVLLTSGTTGPPKGVVQTRGSLAANLDALYAAWEWTAADEVAHALPLHHVHGLVLGTLGPIRLGGRMRHLGRFSSEAIAGAIDDGATMVFGVPTMYHRLAADAEADPAIAGALRRARLLVSGSAALPAADHDRIERATGQRIVERYGMTETIMITSVRADGERRAGYVGTPLPGVELRVLGEDGAPVPADDEAMGDVHVRGPSLMAGYHGRPEATAEAVAEGWFATGDLGVLAPDGYLRLVGRRSTDLIKSGGYRIGAGEIEGALATHPGVSEVAVTAEPDADLGERIVAWVVADGDPPAEADLVQHVADALSPHKRPREVRFVEALPRNAMGKVQKRRLGEPA